MMKKPRTITISERRANPDPFPAVAEPPTRRFADPFLPLADTPTRRHADPLPLAAHLSPLTSHRSPTRRHAVSSLPVADTPTRRFADTSLPPSLALAVA